MINLRRTLLEKFPLKIRENLMQITLHFITENTKPLQVIFFGSIITENFDECSDIDVVAIYHDPVAADHARRVLYGTKKSSEIKHPLEILCVDQKTFDTKSQIGGVFAVALAEGKIFKLTPTKL
jgi:hypothetical protein